MTDFSHLFGEYINQLTSYQKLLVQNIAVVPDKDLIPHLDLSALQLGDLVTIPSHQLFRTGVVVDASKRRLRVLTVSEHYLRQSTTHFFDDLHLDVEAAANRRAEKVVAIYLDAANSRGNLDPNTRIRNTRILATCASSDQAYEHGYDLGLNLAQHRKQRSEKGISAYFNPRVRIVEPPQIYLPPTASL